MHSVLQEEHFVLGLVLFEVEALMHDLGMGRRVIALLDLDWCLGQLM